MGVLKGISALLTTIVALIVFGAIGLAIVALWYVIGFAILGILAIGIIASGIREWWQDRKQRAR